MTKQFSRIDETNEKIFYINNKMNEINRKTQTTQEFYKNKNDEMANQLSVNNQKWYELNNKLTNIKISAYEQKFEKMTKQLDLLQSTIDHFLIKSKTSQKRTRQSFKRGFKRRGSHIECECEDYDYNK
jgi:hypothetical protein